MRISALFFIMSYSLTKNSFNAMHSTNPLPMKKLLFLPLIVLLPLLLTQCGPAAESGDVYIIESVNLLPMDRDTVLAGQTVVVREDRIVATGADGEVTVPSGASRIDGSGKYLMPGLAEMHGHIPPVEQPDSLGNWVKDVLFLYLSNGVTTVRGMQGAENQLQLKSMVDDGEVLGPHLYLAGPPFTGNSVSSPRDAAERVREQHEEGWHLLKVHEGMSTAEYDSMAITANELGIPFGGHIPDDVELAHALEMGQQTVDHLDGYISYMNASEEPVSEEQLQRAVDLSLETGTWVVPTMALWESIIGAADWEAMKVYDEVKYMPENVVENWNSFVDDRQSGTDRETALTVAENRIALLEALHEAGVPVLMGTDSPQIYSVPGFSIHREIPYMSQAGMSNYEILVSGTRTVGEHFSEMDSFGTVAAGQRADLVLLDGNPLEDLGNLRAPAGVMVGGDWIPREEIERRLEEVADRNSPQ